jgi:hypothetical protein
MSPQSALCDVPQVLERSTRNLADVKKCTGAVTGSGVLVKLYLVGDLWIVGSPHTEEWTPSKVDDMRTADATTKANDRTKASYPAKARQSSAHEAKALTQKKLGSRARGEKKATEQQVHKDQDESDDVNSDPEGEEDEGGSEEEEEEEEEREGEEEGEEEGEGEEDVGGEDADEDNAGKQDAAKEDEEEEEDAGEDMNEGLDDSEEGKDLGEEPEKDAVMDTENGSDFEEQDDDEHSELSKQAETTEADKEEDEENGSEEDLAENTRDKRQQEAEGQREAEREVDEYGEETTSDEAQMNNETTGDDNAIQVGQREEHKDDGDKGSVGVHGEVRDEREVVEQRATANHRSGAWRSWAPGHANGREEETRSTTSEGGENTIEADDGSGEVKRKRDLEEDGAMDTSPLGEYPNKRNKGIRGEDENDAPLEASFEGGLETPSRPRTPSPMSPTLSPGSTIKIVRQTSVVPGLEDTENAVWNAAQRDAVFTSLSEAQQEELLRTALSLSSEEGIEELRSFVSNARVGDKQGRRTLTSGLNLTTPDLNARDQLNHNAVDTQSRYLAQFSTVYWRLDGLRKKETLVVIAKRANLAALAQCRESLVPKGVGGNRARDANLKLFRAIFPQHIAIERPDDKTANLAASQDWIRLRNRLQEGRVWLQVRDRFGGVGAFLALPPQCVPDSHISKMPARSLGSLLRLLDVAWRTLDDRARRTMNALVRFALAEQPLPRNTLALEQSEVGISTASAGLSPMLAGWSVADLGAASSDNFVATAPKGHKVGGIDTPQTLLTTNAAIGCDEVVAITEQTGSREMVLAVD